MVYTRNLKLCMYSREIFICSKITYWVIHSLSHVLEYSASKHLLSVFLLLVQVFVQCFQAREGHVHDPIKNAYPRLPWWSTFKNPALQCKGTQLRSLDWELGSHVHEATEPIHCNCWAHVLQLDSLCTARKDPAWHNWNPAHPKELIKKCTPACCFLSPLQFFIVRPTLLYTMFNQVF